MALPDRKRNRMLGYDYSREGLYFVTSCVQGRACVFGHVAEEEMVLNKYGQIATQQWHWLAAQYPYLVLHAFVVMPNHVHGIIEIDQNLVVRTGRDLSAQLPVDETGTEKESSRTKVKSISELMGAYKATTSKQIRLAGLADFAWQRSFHDHIIRHERAYRHIEQYIQNNPALWKDDVFHHPLS
ncbi:transposase [Pontibacter locisalis]|uniref:Transposase n=1 Tax=Pontibacter locisalis TaxID=1719035 RepID=A0ABW5INP7_9BACT